MTGQATYFERLGQSFVAIHAAMEVPRVARRAVLVLLIVHTDLLAYSAYVHSPTLNEPGHLVAGISHWKFGRFELYRVNPPLVRMVAALPVMAVGCEEDWSGFYEGPGARPVFGMGEEFVAANGEQSFFLFTIARWACIPFSWIGAIVCYLWARDLYGPPAGVFACTIWCFEPNILAHASLITADVASAALGVAACYLFWRWLKRPTWMQAAATGAVLGIAELTKTTLILFYPILPVLWLVYRWPDRRGMSRGYWLREAGMVAASFSIGIYILNLGYGFEGSCTQLRDFQFVSDLFTGSDGGEGEGDDAPLHSVSYGNCFGNSSLGELPVPFPKNYLLGIDVQQRDFEHYGQPSYLRGVWRDHGWWYYYLYACTIKVPLGLWLLGAVVIIDRIISVFTPTRWHRVGEGGVTASSETSMRPMAERRRTTAGLRDEFVLVFPALAVFAVVSSKTGFNEHMRYVLPSFPFLFITVSQIVPRICLTSREGLAYPIGSTARGVASARWKRRMPVLLAMLVTALGSWFIDSSLWIYPHSLSYFNESIGGPLSGPQHLLGSNVDWAQDDIYLDYTLPKSVRRKCICQVEDLQRAAGKPPLGDFCVVTLRPASVSRLDMDARKRLPLQFASGRPLTYTQRLIAVRSDE